MPFASGYRGQVQGAVQSTYTDQPNIAVPGMVAFASDLNRIDAFFIGEANGIRAGAGIRLDQNAAAATNYQAPDKSVFLPEADDVLADFGGILVFDESMQSDENGVPGWAKGKVGRVMKPGREGGRIWVKTRVAGAVTDKVWWTVAASGDFVAGDFSAADLGGAASVDLSTVARWVTPPVANGLAMIELF